MRCYQIEIGSLGAYQDYILDKIMEKTKTFFCCTARITVFAISGSFTVRLEVKWLDEMELRRRHMALDVNEINVESNTNNNQYRIVSAPKHKSWSLKTFKTSAMLVNNNYTCNTSSTHIYKSN